MKKVFSNYREVAHIWAADSQDEARSYNMSFKSPWILRETLAIQSHSVIYSYSTAMGMLLTMVDGRKVLILNTSSYSPTTSKHQSAIAGAISGRDYDLKLFYPVHLRRGGEHLLSFHQSQIDDMAGIVESDVLTLLGKAERARKNADLYRAQAAGRIQTLKAYADFLGFEYTPPALDYAALKAAADAAEAAEAAKREKAEAERIAAQAENLLKWLAGQDIRNNFAETKLRIKADEIETSHGARIPLAHAVALWPMLARWKAEGKTYSGAINGRTIKLGHYSVDSFDGHTLKVGCHYIPWDELDRIAGLLGLEKPEPVAA